ncbi:hypothetical protein ILUMI_09482, partial [Ignelater luminosus]
AYTYWTLASVTMTLGILVSLVKRIINSNYRELPYGAYMTLNTTSSFNYEISWLYQVVSFSACGCACATIDLLICSTLVHVSYQFKILQNFLEQMVEVSYKNMIEVKCHLHDHEEETDNATISSRYLHEIIKRAVSYHVAILDVAFDIETTFSELLLMSFLVTLALVCISVFHMAMATNLMATLRYLSEASIAVLQVAIYCYWGEQVNRESQLVGFFAYNSNFPGTDLRFQRALAFIIRRSQTPTVITAGGFTDIGLPTFFWILHTSYSAFMMLRNGGRER